MTVIYLEALSKVLSILLLFLLNALVNPLARWRVRGGYATMPVR